MWFRAGGGVILNVKPGNQRAVFFDELKANGQKEELFILPVDGHLENLTRLPYFYFLFRMDVEENKLARQLSVTKSR